MKILIVGDIHYNDRPPSARTDSYPQDILDKLTFTVEAAHEQEVDAVVWVGDVFHSKAPSKTSHWAVQRIAEIGLAYEKPWLIVPGNHDITHDRLDSLPKQPLGTLYKLGATKLVGQMVDLPLFGVPYLHDWGLLRQLLERRSTGPLGTPGSLVVAHAPIMPPGVTVPYEFIDARDWTEIQGGGYCYYGHIHDNHGTYEAHSHGSELMSVTFCNHGALSRGSLHETDLARKPALTTWDSETGLFLRTEVPHKPPEEAYTLEEVHRKEEKKLSLEEFLGSVEATELDQLSVEAAIEQIRSMNLDPTIRELAVELLEHVS